MGWEVMAASMPGGIGGNVKPLLEQGVAAVVVGVGVGVEDAGKHPALGFQDLLHLAPGVLVAAAVDEHRAARPAPTIPSWRGTGCNRSGGRPGSVRT